MEKMKYRCFLLTILFIVFSFSVNANEIIESTALVVPIKDLTESIKPDGKKYFMLSLSDFEKLKSEKQRVIDSISSIKKTPSYVNISSTKISGTIGENFIFATANIEIEKIGDDYKEITILSGKLAVEKALLNKKPVPLNLSKKLETKYTFKSSDEDSDWHDIIFSLPLTQSGKNNYEISFIAPIYEDKLTKKVSFSIGASPITLLELTSNSKLIEIDNTSIPNYSITNNNNGGCLLTGQLGSTSNINIEWRNIIPITQETVKNDENTQETPNDENTEKEAIASETQQITANEQSTTQETASETEQIAVNEEDKKEVKEEAPEPPKPNIIANASTMFSINTNKIYITKNVDYKVSRAPVEELCFDIPYGIDSKDISVLANTDRIRIEEKCKLKIVSEDGKRVLKATLPRIVFDNCSLKINYAQNIGTYTSFILPEFVCMNVERERGKIAIVSLGSDEIRTANSEKEPLGKNTNEIDAAELPYELKRQADRPILFAYNYLSAPSNIALSIARNKNIEQKYTVADNMIIRTNFNSNQTSNTEIELNIRNTSKHQLKFFVASDTNLTFSHYTINGKTNKLTMDASGTPTISLMPARNSLEPDNTNIVISFKQSIASLTNNGAMQFKMPVPNIPVSKVYWKLYAPENIHLYGFKGSLEELSNETKIPFFLSGFIFFYDYAKSYFSDKDTLLGIFIIIAIVLIIVFYKIVWNVVKAVFSSFGSGISALSNYLTAEKKEEEKQKQSGCGFSLIELGIVIVVIGVLSSMSMPNFKTSRFQARHKACYSNIRVIQGAVEMYNADSSSQMSYLNMANLVKGGYIKPGIKCPETNKEDYYGENLDSDGEVYCLKHGNLSGSKVGSTMENQSVMLAKPSQSDSYKSKMPPTPVSIKTLSKKPEMPAHEARTNSFGAQKRSGAKALVTKLQTTNNMHDFRRDLVLPEIDNNGALKQNSTYPIIQFGYINKTYQNGINILSAIIAFICAIGFLLGAAKWNKSKMITAVIIISVLSIADMNYFILGSAFNTVFWSILSLGVVFTILKNINNKEMVLNNSGFTSLIITLLILLSVLLAPPAFSAENTVKNINVLAPVIDFSKMITENGNFVFLTEEDYNYLKDQEIPETKTIKNPNPFQIKSISYIGKEENKDVKFTAKYIVEVLNEGYQEIPLISKSAVVTSLKFDGKPYPAAFSKEYKYNGLYCLLTNEIGNHEIELEFIINTQNGEDEFSPRKITVNTIFSGITTLKFLPKDNSEISVTPAALKEAQQTKENYYEAVIHPSNKFTITLTPKKTAEALAIIAARAAEAARLKAEEERLKAEEEAKRKAEEEAYLKSQEIVDETQQEEIIIETIPTKINTNCITCLFVQDTYLSGLLDCKLNVTGTDGITKLRFAIPQKANILNVTDPENNKIIRDWQEIQIEKDRFISITFNSEIKNTERHIFITFEQDLENSKEKSFDVPEFMPLNTDDAKGYLAVSCIKDIDINPGIPEGYENSNLSNIPRRLADFLKDGVTPIVYHFNSYPNSLKIEVNRPESADAITAIIDNAEALSIISPSGDIFTKYKFKIRNNSEQFLKVKLPSRNGKLADLWESKCDNKPTIAGLDENNNTINIPIIKSQRDSNDDAQPFFAEITYHEKIDSLDKISSTTISLPSVHLTITELKWEIATPYGYEISKESGNVEETHKLLSFINAKDKAYANNNNNIGLLPVSFKLPMYANNKYFNLLSVEPESRSPFINLNIYGKPTKNLKTYTLFASLLGCLLGFSLVQLFITQKHKLLWIIVFAASVILVGYSITNILIAQTSITAAAATIIMYLIAILIKNLNTNNLEK